MEEFKEMNKKTDNKLKFTVNGPGTGKTQIFRFYSKYLLKDLNKTPEEKAKQKEEEAKKKKIREDNRRGWVK